MCRLKWGVHTVPEIHHIRAGAGAGRKNSDDLTIPLCPEHHRLGGYGVAYHGGRHAFEAAFETELELLARVEAILSLPVEDAGDLPLPDTEGP